MLWSSASGDKVLTETAILLQLLSPCHYVYHTIVYVQRTLSSFGLQFMKGTKQLNVTFSTKIIIVIAAVNAMFA